MDALPKGWINAELMDLIELHDNMRVPLNQTQRNSKKGNYPYYGANGQVDAIDEYMLDGNYILLAEDGGYFDDPKRGVAYEVSGKFWVNNHAHILSTRGGIPQRYLRYVLNSLDWMQYVGGSTRLKLTQEGMRKIHFSIPPLNEQKRIAGKLDNLFTRSRAAREELYRIPRLIERYKQAILSIAFSGDLTRDWRKRAAVENVTKTLQKLPKVLQPRGGREATDSVIEGIAGLSVNNPGTEVPSKWAWVKLLDIARQETGHTPSRRVPEYWSKGKIPWLGIKDAGLHHGGVIADTLQHITKAGVENSSARLLPAGTVCLSRTASVGYVVIMGKDMTTSQDFATWTCSEALQPKYLMYALMAEGEDIKEFGEGTTHTTIYFPEIRALHIKLAPVEEQKEIVRRIEKAFAAIDAIATQTAAAQRQISNLEARCLNKAFRGKLVPQDPNDEPASVLLERLKAQPATAKRKRAGKKPALVDRKPHKKRKA